MNRDGSTDNEATGLVEDGVDAGTDEDLTQEENSVDLPPNTVYSFQDEGGRSEVETDTSFNSSREEQEAQRTFARASQESREIEETGQGESGIGEGVVEWAKRNGTKLWDKIKGQTFY